MNKFKDAIYGKRKEIVILKLFSYAQHTILRELKKELWTSNGTSIVHGDKWLIKSLSW